MKFKSCNLHFSWNGDFDFNIHDVEFSLYSFNLFKVTSSLNDAISTAFIAISNSHKRDFDMDSLIFEIQIVFYFQLFLSANVRHGPAKIMQVPSLFNCIYYYYYFKFIR